MQHSAEADQSAAALPVGSGTGMVPRFKGRRVRGGGNDCEPSLTPFVPVRSDYLVGSYRDFEVLAEAVPGVIIPLCLDPWPVRPLQEVEVRLG